MVASPHHWLLSKISPTGGQKFAALSQFWGVPGNAVDSASCSDVTDFGGESAGGRRDGFGGGGASSAFCDDNIISSSVASAGSSPVLLLGDVEGGCHFRRAVVGLVVGLDGDVFPALLVTSAAGTGGGGGGGEVALPAVLAVREGTCVVAGTGTGDDDRDLDLVGGDERALLVLAECPGGEECRCRFEVGPC